MTEDMLFDRHYKILKKLHHDSLIILDNFNVLPRDDRFFREFAHNDFQLLITTRCHPTQYPILELKELDADTELPELFYRLCPSAKEDAPTVKKIIQTVHSHTLTVVLSALSLSASGMEAEELLYELQTCGLSISSGEAIELYKDGDYTDGLMTIVIGNEHRQHYLLRVVFPTSHRACDFHRTRRSIVNSSLR